MMKSADYNVLVVLGPTASGKTRLGVRLAKGLGGEILSADSRQVYRGLDIGSGKDLDEYVIDGTAIPYHLIDIVDLDFEFSVFDYQQRFYETFEEVTGRGPLPVVVGGTGLYLEAALKGYRMVAVPEDPAFRDLLSGCSDEALIARLRAVKPDLHNTTDLRDRNRLIRAIEIAEYSKDHPPPPAPDLRPFILGTRWDRGVLRARIRERLRTRLDRGMIEEVERLHGAGTPWARLELLGLEYRHIARYLQGTTPSKEELFDGLYTAIGQFAKRQETWFRRMERRGATIHWVEESGTAEAVRLVKDAFGDRWEDS